MSNLTEETELASVKLDFEQRQRANALLEAVENDPMQAAFEIVWLRDRLRKLTDNIADRGPRR